MRIAYCKLLIAHCSLLIANCALFSQAYFIHLLCLRGNFQLAQERLEKMRAIPEWSNDICFQLAELSVALSSAAAASGAESEEEFNNNNNNNNSNGFSVNEAIYSLQELIQLYGPSPRLQSNLAALLAVVGKFGDAQATLSRAVGLDADGEANAVAISAHLSGNAEVIR